MKKILFLIIISSLILASCGKDEIEEKKFYKTHTVWEWYISSKDSLLSTVQGMNVSDLSFKNPWRIKEIFVKKWDIVKSGQILATLSNEEASINYVWALNILNEIKNMWFDITSMWNDTEKIKSSIEKIYDEKLNFVKNDYEKSKINVSMAQKDLDLAKSNLKNISEMLSGTSLSNDQKIKQALNALEMAKNNLDNSKKLLDLENSNIQKNAISSLTNAYIIARNAKEYIDSILGVTSSNRYKNDDFENYLWAKDSNSKTKAETSFNLFNSQYEETYKMYSESIVGKTNIPKETLVNILNKSLTTLESLRNNLHDTKDMLDKSITSVNFDGNTLNWMKNQTSAFLWDLEQIILSPTWAWVKWSIEAIESFENSYNLKIKQLEDAYKIAAEDVNLAKTGKDIVSSDISKNIDSLKTNIVIKEESLNIAKISEEQANKNIELTKQEKASKIAEIDANLSEIKSKLSEAGSMKAEIKMNADMAVNGIESWIIRAPFDWIILDKNFDIGSVVWAWIPIFKISSNDWKYLKISFDNSVYGLSAWREVKLKDEKDWKTLTWKIISINQIQDIVTKKNYSEIQIYNENTQIWERLSVLLWKEEQEKNIIIPTNSIVSKYGKPWVYSLQKGIVVFKIIKIKDSDEAFSAVEWVMIWDKIITEWKDNMVDWEKLD